MTVISLAACRRQRRSQHRSIPHHSEAGRRREGRQREPDRHRAEDAGRSEGTGRAGSSQWSRHVVVERASAAHTLWSADLDLDGDRDILAAELGRPRVTWYENLDGRGTQWRAEKLETEHGSIHNGLVADLDRDGDLDVFGAGFTGQPTKATIWWNRLNPERLPIGPFTAIEVTRRHVRAFGITVIDLNGDGFKDIAAGPYWYRNPGGDMAGPWEQNAFPLNPGS